jgi:hypothetical protein
MLPDLSSTTRTLAGTAFAYVDEPQFASPNVPLPLLPPSNPISPLLDPPGFPPELLGPSSSSKPLVGPVAEQAANQAEAVRRREATARMDRREEGARMARRITETVRSALQVHRVGRAFWARSLRGESKMTWPPL